MKTKKIAIHAPFAILTILSVAFWFGMTEHALAITIQGADNVGGGGGSTLGDLFSNACANTKPFAKIFSYVAWTAAVLFTAFGIYHVRMHTDSPGQHSLNKPIMLFSGAGLLFALPSALITVASSLGYATSPTMAGCLPAGSAGGAAGGGLDSMMANFVANIEDPLTALVQMIANVCGVWMMVNGLVKASKYGYDPKSNSVQSIVTNVGFGAILFTIGGNFSMVMASVFGNSSISSPSVLNWNLPTSVSPQFTTAVTAALQFIQVIGFIAFVRGWLLLKKVVEGGSQATMAQAITHIIGGVLAINIAAFLKAMDTTFGTNLLS